MICVTFMNAGCVTPIKNSRLESYDPSKGYRFQNLDLNEGNTDELLVILTFSGGGTRAASFAYGVLEQLKETQITFEGKERSLLNEVDIISSVSGGSLASAAYGLYGQEFFETFPNQILHRDIQGYLIGKVLRIWNYPKLLSPYYGRSDLLAEEFDEYFKKKTFGDLLKKKERPFIVINSTDVTKGQQFQFTQNYFDFLYSNLESYKLSRSVAASAAVPGLLTSMSLANYPKQDDYVAPQWIQETLNSQNRGFWTHRRAQTFQSFLEPNRKFVHLVDGGVSDNLGLLPAILFVAQFPEMENLRKEILDRKTKKVVIITVNAKTKKTYRWDLKNEIVGFFKMLSMVTGNPMDDFSNSQIEYMRLLIEKIKMEKAHDGQLAAHHIPHEKSADSQLDYTFVELSFEQVPDEIKRIPLLGLPTSFKLERDQVNQIIDAAKTVMDNNPDYQALLRELRQ